MLNHKRYPAQILVLLLLTGELLIADIDPGGFQFTDGQVTVDIPFYTFNNQVILTVIVNDKVPLNFILDSGSAQAIFFDRKLASQLGIGFGRKIQFSGVGDNNIVTAYRARGVKLALPGVEGNMMGMAILATDYLEMKRFDIHGVIGYQLFARFAIKIDYQTRTLSLMEPSMYQSDGYQSLPVEIKDSKPYLNTSIGLNGYQNVPLNLMIDTGGSFGLSLINGSHPAIRPPEDAYKVLVGSGLGGNLQGYRGKATLKFNKELQTESDAIFINHREFSKKGKDNSRSGSIGNDLFKEYVVIFDYVNSKILLQPHKSDYYTGNYRLISN
ncbi:MAG: hypothetical protein DHS20C17_18960 [Cyclobacteriaceae bacterium]|nr:MAG: hypothetical protein DHS20C17_18960 [Cyclobacteriaceae bacterium]